MKTLAELEEEARARVARVDDDPSGRYALREAFYARYGAGNPLDPDGYGQSELAFLRWEMDRRVLDPLTTAGQPGSGWWRAVNGRLLYAAELASLVYEEGLGDDVVPDEVRFWIEYIRKPSGRAWYKAHNGSIARGYLAHRELAREESKDEQLFMNEVLYRLLYAEALIEGEALGVLGEIAADPALPAVDFLVRVVALYPANYPLTAEDVENLEHTGKSLGDLLAKVLDEGFILPHLTELFDLVAGLIAAPDLARLVKDGVPIYPDIDPTICVPSIAVTRPMDTTTTEKKKQKIAILGGGMAALSAALELTRAPGWEKEYEVTVYQIGWRFGGKTATGRGPKDRIEEHGIHILQGWYDNTFRLIDEVYRERREKKLDPGSPYQEWTEAFDRDSATLLTEFIPGRGWVNWPVVFPQNDELPGQGPPLPLWEMLKKLVALALETVLGSPYQAGIGPVSKWILDLFYPDEDQTKGQVPASASHPHWWSDLVDKALSTFQTVEATAETKLLQYAREILPALDAPSDGTGPSNAHAVVEALHEVLRFVENKAEQELDRDDGLRRMVTLIELAWVNLKGVIEDVWDPEANVFRFERINHLDYREWIRKHGASERVALCGPVRFIYTGTFANLVDGFDGGRIAAGSALHFVLQSAGYKGAFVWKFKAGTGDTLVMPVYEVLKARGVKLELFQEVKNVPYSPGGSIEEIEIAEQVTLKDGNYEPTFRVGNIRAWPSHPFYEQIDPAEARLLQERHVDLEDPWADWTPPRTRTLKKGVHFDHVVLAIPVGGLKDCCKSIVEKDERWGKMVSGVRTVGTQAMQLWLRPTLKELGMNLADWGMAENAAPNTVSYANPMYSWIDMSLVLKNERWTEPGAPRLLVYFTGILPDPEITPPYSDHRFPEEQLARVRTMSFQWLTDNMGYFWPKGGAAELQQGLDPRHLVDAYRTSPTDDQRFESQYFRANLAPAARFTLAVPGTDRFRLKPGDSGFSNMVLAGDWTDYGMNVGYIEGAIVSGTLAAQALLQRLGLGDERPLLMSPDVAR
jgi:uncharacterized protein with NAD-binding domain and iron-sulfur cluster